MDELIADFLVETNEGLAELDSEIVQFEQNPNDKKLLGNIFRIVHTIKGTCGFLGLSRLEKLGHAAENILGRFRDGELDVQPIAVSLIFRSLDTIKELLEVIGDTGAEPAGEDQGLIDELNEIADNGYVNVGKEGGTGAVVEEAPAAVVEPVAPAAESDAPTLSKQNNTEEELQALFDSTEVLPTAAAAAPPAAAPAPAPVEAKEGKPASEKAAPVQTIRVTVDVLEDLMTMVSELVLTRNQLMQLVRDEENSALTAPLQRLNHVTSELQEGVMKTRMQPIGNAWAKLPRIIRDLSVDLKKKIDLDMRGADTELDRQILEFIRDPLTHMVRNSADHGIESPAERIAAGKPETGKVILDAYHEGGHIIIEISDDGKGLNLDRIKNKILENGLATEKELGNMSDQQIQQFVFKAGFSTAEKVTNVSGRGVGMDVVVSNIEKISGTVELKSQEGKGSKFTIKIPLTLAIVSALIIESAGEKFAISQLSVTELVRVKKDGNMQIEYIDDVPVLRLRNKLLPLVSLAKIIKMEDKNAPKAGEGDNGAVVMVTKVGSYTFGILVDRVFDTEEIVVKPVSSLIRDIPIYAGNTILGDGSVIMILDANGIAEATGEISLSDSSQDSSENADLLLDDRNSVLLFTAGDGMQKGVPLSLIARLEEFPKAQIEQSGDGYVIQYRNALMRLFPLDPHFNLDNLEKHPVLVFSEGDRNLGLIVSEIKDIVQEKVDIQMSDSHPGTIGNCIIDGSTTDFLDTSYYLTQAYPDWFDGVSQLEAGDKKSGSSKPVVLFIDDSSFFRNMLQPEIESCGYTVVAVDNAVKALKVCNSNQYHFDAIITDIEMPEMSGFEFARALREITKYKDTPLLALSAFDDPKYLEEGRELGFVDYVCKTDRDTLACTLELSLSNIIKVSA